MEDLPITTFVGVAGFMAGILFGGVANKTNFCTMGALSDLVYMGHSGRFRSWMLAMAVAIAGSQAMHMAGMVDLGASIYISPNFGWFGAILGGVLFGFGMTIAGGCANKNLIRVGGGNLKSVFILMIMGITAYATMRGLIALARIEMEAVTVIDLSGFDIANHGIPVLLGAATGIDAGTLRPVIAAVFVLTLLVYCFKDAGFRKSADNVIGGLVVGAMVPVGWWITGVYGFDDFDPTPLTSFSFVAPAGQGLQYVMTFTGATISFGVAAAAGVIVGSFLVAMATRSFHIEAYSHPGEMTRNLIGAVMMGMGGVLALGCTIGQGLSGMSTLALGSLIAIVSIIFGGLVGLKYLEEGSLGAAVKAVAARDW